MVKDFKRWTTQLAATVLYNGRGAANLCSLRLRLSGGRTRFPPIKNNSCPVNFEILHSVFGMRTGI